MLIRKGLRYVFMDAASGGEGGAAGGGGGAAGGAAAGSDQGGAAGPAGSAPGAAAAAAASAGTAAAGGSAAAGAAGAAGAEGGTALQAGAQTVSIPEKYQVKKEDGSLDIEASSLKLAEAYGHLEKRLGTGDAPPKSAEEYEIKVPDALKDVWKPAEDPLLTEFLKDAHAAGFTQKQIDLAMSRYLELAPKLVAGSSQLSADDCVAQLKTEWKTDDDYKAGVGKAYQAAVAYFGQDADAMIKEYGNDPRLIRGLARIGAEMGEDKTPNSGGGSVSGDSIAGLMASEAYTNPKHADHARVSKQIADHFQRQAAAAEKAGASPLM